MRQPAHILPFRRLQSPLQLPVSFDRRDFRALLSVYARMVSLGEWKDYALDFEEDFAQFAVFSRSSDSPAYRIEKRPGCYPRQGFYVLIGSNGQVLRRSTEIERLLRWFEGDRSSKASVLPFCRRNHAK